MEYKVLVLESFTDKYTGVVYKSGDILEGLTEERVNEINAVKKGLISTISKQVKETENVEAKKVTKPDKQVKETENSEDK